MRALEIVNEQGRIVKGVNTTVDVGPDEIKTQAAKFGNSVDKDGRPPTLSKRVKGKSTNVLYNLGLTESTNYATIEEALGEIASATEIYVDMDGVLADFFGEWAKLMNVDHFNDIPKQHNIEDALQKIRDTEDFWLNLPLTDNAKNLLGLIKQVKGSYKILSSPLADDPRSEPHKREWIANNLGFFLPKDVIITHNKPKYATKSDGTPNILIDDYGKNIAAWEAAGGIGFKHKDHKFERTAKNIKQHMQEPVEESLDIACPRTKANKCQCESVNKVTEAEETLTAVCVLEHSDKVKGTILLKQQPGKPTLIVGKITGLSPGEHGFHIHEFGDLSNGCESAGAHYNPDGVDHGSLDEGHVGDLGNVTADKDGVADINIVARRIDLAGDRSVVGRAIVIHEDQDDLGQGGDDESLKTGNAGDRLACGVITLKETVNENFTEGKFRANDIEEFKPSNDALNNLKSKYLPDWEMLDHRILQAKYVAADHREAEAFIRIINKLSEKMDHFCEVTQDVAEVTIKTTTFDVKGLTILDFQIAMLIDRFTSDVGIKQAPMSGNFGMHENFADGKVKGKSRPGRVKRAGASCKGTVTKLRKQAKNASGEKAKMYRWCANMKSGKKK